MIAIIDYEAGNIASVKNALSRFNVEFCLTNKIDELEKADAIIFPGQGHFGTAKKNLIASGVDEWLKQTTKPVLGICVGMQLLFEGSEESDVPGLGIIKGHLKRFDQYEVKVPQMGWNTISVKSNHPILNGFSDKTYFYFVHSYYVPLTSDCLASCTYQQEYSAIVAKDNFIGVQFHPEKSGVEGAMLLQNFIQLAEKPLLS